MVATLTWLLAPVPGSGLVRQRSDHHHEVWLGQGIIFMYNMSIRVYGTTKTALAYVISRIPIQKSPTKKNFRVLALWEVPGTPTLLHRALKPRRSMNGDFSIFDRQKSP